MSKKAGGPVGIGFDPLANRTNPQQPPVKKNERPNPSEKKIPQKQSFAGKLYDRHLGDAQKSAARSANSLFGMVMSKAATPAVQPEESNNTSVPSADASSEPKVNLHATNNVDALLRQLRGGCDDVGISVIQEETVEWDPTLLPTCRALPAHSGANWPFFAGDIEWWDAPFLNAPSYALGIKANCLDSTAAVETEKIADAENSSPSHNVVLSGPNVLPSEQTCVIVAKTPQEIKRERRARKRERAAQHELDVRLGLVAEAQRTTTHSILAAFKGEAAKSFAVSNKTLSELTPSAMEEKMRRERQDRVDEHYRRNHIAHHLAIPNQRLAKLRTTLRHARTDPEVALFRFLNIGDAHLCKRNLDRIKINAKDHYLRGVIVWISRRHAVAALIGGRNPMRKMRHLVRSRLTWYANDVNRDDSNRSVRHLVVDQPWSSSLVDIVEEKATARSEELFAKVKELKKKQESRTSSSKEKEQEHATKLAKAQSILFSEFLFSNKRVILHERETEDESTESVTEPVTVGGGESVKLIECDTALAAMRIFEKAGLGHAWDCAVQEPVA